MTIQKQTKYHDQLQAKIEARVLRASSFDYDVNQFIGLLMLEENLFYKEAKTRWEQATTTLY